MVEPASTARVLVAGVGYFNQSDLSIGGHVIRALQEEEWGAGYDVEELSYGPIAVIHRLNEQEPRHRRAVFVGAVQRDRRPGEIVCYRWDGHLPPEDEIQGRVGQALSGVVDLENLLIITEQFEALPKDVVVVEIEPVSAAAGLELSTELAAEMPRLLELVRRFAETPTAELDLSPLGRLAPAAVH